MKTLCKVCQEYQEIKPFEICLDCKEYLKSYS